MLNFDFEYYKSLSEAFSPSGFEGEVRSRIIERIRPHVDELFIDGMGNLIVTKGQKDALLICAHMDEVGFMITGIFDDGTLRFHSVGGINPDILSSKSVLVGNNKIRGIISSKPIHLNKDKKEKIKFDDLFIDIGARDKADAEKHVKVGDFAAFATECTRLGETVYGKAHDNRIGCYVLSRLIETKALENGTFVFTTQEETGCRGAATIMQNGKFKFGIALDTTTANDLPEVLPHKTVSSLDLGPVISFADGATVYNRDLIRSIFRMLEEKEIPAQTKNCRTGGNEASPMEKMGYGCKQISISTPCRYIHGPIGLFHVCDAENTIRATAEIAKFVNKEALK